MLKVAILACLCVATLAGSSGSGSGYYVLPEGYKAEAQPEPAALYNFRYGIRDDDEQVYIKHSEERNDDTVKGEYSWIAPDGDKITVKYSANADTGYVADVQREEGVVKIHSKEAPSYKSQSSEESNERSAPTQSYGPPPSYYTRGAKTLRYNSEPIPQESSQSQSSSSSSESQSSSSEEETAPRNFYGVPREYYTRHAKALKSQSNSQSGSQSGSQSQEQGLIGYEQTNSRGHPTVVKTYSAPAHPKSAQEPQVVYLKKVHQVVDDEKRHKTVFLQKIFPGAGEQPSRSAKYFKQSASQSSSSESQELPSRSSKYFKQSARQSSSSESHENSYQAPQGKVVYLKKFSGSLEESNSESQSNEAYSYATQTIHKSQPKIIYVKARAPEPKVVYLKKAQQKYAADPWQYDASESKSEEEQERVTFKKVAAKYFEEPSHRVVFLKPVAKAAQKGSYYAKHASQEPPKQKGESFSYVKQLIKPW
jgi:hypothetical protein